MWRKRFCIKNLKSTCVSGDENIKEFSGYFSQVGQPNTTNADLMYEKRVREYLFEHPDLCNGSARAVEVSLLHECISDLKLHKAASHDGIYNEHIIHAGPQLVVHCVYCSQP